MARIKQLLNKPLRAFAWYAFLILACSIPAYYFIMDYIWVSELDEHNRIIAARTQHSLNAITVDELQIDQHVEFWNKVQPNAALQPTKTLRPDSVYNLYKQKPFAPNEDIDRFQGLVTYFTIHGKPYRFTVETNVEESHETIFSITLVTMLFFVLLLLGFILINKRISAKLWQPFYHTLEKLKAFNLDKQTNITFEASDIAEFEELNQVLTKLIGANVLTYQRQKEFTENASHELQTPLAILQTKLELLLQNQALNKEQSHHIAEAHKALARATRINKNLLLLAKIENQQYSVRQRINLQEVISDSLDLFSDYAKGKKIRIQTKMEAESGIQGNKSLVDILVANLLLNAIKHNVEAGEIHITLSAGHLSIYNSGEAALNADQLFKRFSRVNVQTPGTGLGLAIVKEICVQHNWHIDYCFQSQQHCFSIKFSETR